jgi:hypothetical protein
MVIPKSQATVYTAEGVAALVVGVTVITKMTVLVN